jgi:hypothetical protein
LLRDIISELEADPLARGVIRRSPAICLGLPKGASLRILLTCIGLAWAATVLLVSLAEKQQEAALGKAVQLQAEAAVRSQ